LTDERKVVKQPGKPITNAKAKTLSVPNLAEFQKILMNVHERDDYCIILGYVPGTEDGKSFTILSQARMRHELKLKDDEIVPGEPVKIDNRGLLVTRTRELFHFSSIGLFDYDRVKGMPKALEFDSPQDWLKAMEEAVPGFASAGGLVVPSTSSRVLLNGKPAFNGGGWHCYVQIEDAEDFNRFGAELMVHIMSTNYGFMRPIFSQASGDVIGHRPWGPYDPTTFSPERLVFDGSPKLNHKDLELTPTQLSVIEGGRLDTSLLTVEDNQFKTVKKQTGYQVKRQSNGLLQLTNGTDLKLDTRVTTERGAMTIEEYWRDSKDLKKLRCQAAFRPDSDSWAAFLNTHDDGTPFLYDVGCQIKFTLSKSELTRYTHKKTENWRSSLMLTIVKPESLQEIEDAVQMTPELPIMEQQITQVVAPPGCGKTAVLMAAGTLWASRGYEVHYYQVDVGGADLKVYHQMAEDGGFTLHSTLDCSMNDLRVSLHDIATEARPGELKHMVFIIDTYKKIAADVLSKKNNSAVAEVFRKITQKGGTVIALGHCNKHRDAEGNLVFSGTQDVMDDCDALIVFDGIKDEKARQVVVNAEFRKGRTVNDFPFGLVIHRGDCLADNWVEFNVPPDPNLPQLNVKEALRSRQEAVIGAVRTILETDGPMSQTDLVAAVQDWCAANLKSTPGEKRIRGILHKLEGDEWTCNVDPQKSNAKIYENNPDFNSKPEPEETGLTADDGKLSLPLSKTDSCNPPPCQGHQVPEQ
jgi:hypothetical protein